MGFDHIKGQEAAVKVIRQAQHGGRLAHAYLFVGPSGVGKQKVALALAQAENCAVQPDGCGRCESCRRIAEGKHPDVRVFEPRDDGNRNLQVDFIRDEVLPFVKFAPFEGKAAYLIFPQADVSFPVQHAEAANALLKTLEEPRRNVRFVLTSERPDRLLSTIRSRCQRVRFALLTPAVLDAILAEHNIPVAQRPAASSLAGGRADAALALCEEGRADALVQWAEQIDEALSQGDGGALLGLSEDLSRSDQRPLVLHTLALFYRDVAAHGLGLDDAQLALSHRVPLVAARSAQLAPALAAARVARLQQLEADLERNANPQLALDAALLSMLPTP